MDDDKVNILIVDDSPQKLLAIEVVLAELGQNIVQALSGEEALRLLLAMDFAVILLDVNMPGMDGFETAALIRGRRQSEHTPIIFVTAMSEETHAVEGYSLGAVDYILAPVIPEVLRAKVSVFVDLHRKNRQVERQAEERVALIRAEAARSEAEQANRAKSQFLANISHELRTPMNAIIGMTDLALEEDVSPTVRDYLQTARESAAVLMALLNEILDVSRLESGKFELETAPFDPRAVVEQSVRTLALRAQQKGLEIVCDLPSDLPASIVGDGLRLRQVLTNLISNAIKFTDKGDVVFELRCVHEKSGREKNVAEDGVAILTFQVRDSGIGISPADQERIFAPFTQADSSTTRLYGGSGLGLAIASSLVSMMGSQLEVASGVGRGSTFSFCAAFPVASPARRWPADLVGRRILVVDDHPASLKAVARMLEARGAAVIGATDGRIADALWRGAVGEKAFSGAVVDATLPDVDGLELARRLCRSQARPAPVVLMVTPQGRKHCRENLPAGEPVILLDKPVVADELRTAFDRAVSAVPAVAAAASAKPQQPISAARQLRILVAEDTPANQKLIERTLSRRGHRVELVGNGQEAVVAAAAETYDVILMDIQMPVMGGLDAAEAIRAAAPGNGVRRVPIVALTAHAMRGDERRCLDAGMDAYMAKPIDVRRLIELVESISQATAAENLSPTG